MNWTAISAIGQLLATLAVFASLGYVAVQLRHARDEVRRSIHDSRAEVARNLLLTRATDTRLTHAYVKATVALSAPDGPLPAFVDAVMARTGLSIEDAAALYWEQLAWWQYRLQVIPYVDDLPPGPRVEFESGIRRNYRDQPLERLFYETTKAGLPPAAVRYIDGLLASTD